MYTVKEIFFSIQGEGAQTGRPAVFCRFSGCNLWNGKEEDRGQAVCDFCDTDFIGTNADGGKFRDATELAAAILQAWPEEQPNHYVIFTGGEPLLQLNPLLIEAVKQDGFEVAVETNGTLEVPEGVDWICVSPKIGAKLRLKRGDELKLVYPQRNCDPERFLSLEFDHFFLQPMDGANRVENIDAAYKYCQAHPPWDLSIQTQKLVGIR